MNRLLFKVSLMFSFAEVEDDAYKCGNSLWLGPMYALLGCGARDYPKAFIQTCTKSVILPSSFSSLFPSTLTLEMKHESSLTIGQNPVPEPHLQTTRLFFLNCPKILIILIAVN